MRQARSQFRQSLAWPIVLAGTITLCSGFPAAVPQAGGFEPDKLGHFAAYGSLATAIIRVPGLARWPLLGLWWALPLASGYGLGDEFRQSLTAGVRTADWADWVADTIGATVAVALYLKWAWYRRLLESPLFKKRAKPATPAVSSDK